MEREKEGELWGRKMLEEKRKQIIEEEKQLKKEARLNNREIKLAEAIEMKKN